MISMDLLDTIRQDILIIPAILIVKLISSKEKYGLAQLKILRKARSCPTTMDMTCFVSRITRVDVGLKTVLDILFEAILDGELKKG